MFSTLAARGGETATEDHRIADSLFRFCQQHGRNDQGDWIFKVSRTGEILPGTDSIFVAGFILMGMASYLPISGENASTCRELLRRTADRVLERLATPGSYGSYPYELPAGAKCHGVAMLFALAFQDAGVALADPSLLAKSIELADDVMTHFVSDEDRALLEFLRLDNQPLDGPIGRCCVPGHAIESMWALIQIYRAANLADRIPRCIEVIRWHIALAWDPEHGGVSLAVDLDGNPQYWKKADFKPWWPAVESMYALLLAYQESGESWCLEWYERVHNYAFSHYLVRPDGEWCNRLDREGRPTEELIALPVKDPFHLPRAFLFSIDVLKQLRDNPAKLNLITP
ncbi:MAG: AGE family epimerase/isomerase [Candidatus Synoicihabitans palmerolidicus]|nr:AGE family epimerase/isomerase [Candidatus Synoicihabitans palmerolidicus]